MSESTMDDKLKDANLEDWEAEQIDMMIDRIARDYNVKHYQAARWLRDIIPTEPEDFDEEEET